MAYVVAGYASRVKGSTDLTASQRAQVNAELRRLCKQPREIEDLQVYLVGAFPDLWERLHWRAVEELCQELVAEGTLTQR